MEVKDKWGKQPELSVLLGQTCTAVKNVDGAELVFFLEDGRKFMVYHDQDCCESVDIEDIAGDLQDLVGSPITLAEEVSNIDLPAKSEYDDYYTWTFYKFATIKGYVDVRWYGTSNGYYSESVQFAECK